MTETHLDALEREFSAIIEQMPDEFDSHQFILRLAQEHQRLYVLALADYVDTDRPFQNVHAQLARRLHNFPNLISYQGDRNSENIFRQENSAAVWRKRTVEDYRTVFLAIRDRITPDQMVMLQTHYRAPDRIITTTELARVVGYEDYRGANLWYGELAKLVAEEINYRPPENFTWLSILVEFQPSSNMGRYPMRMRPNVVRALEELGWV